MYAGKSKIKVLTDLESGENLPSCFTDYSLLSISFLCPHKMEGAREFSGASFLRILIPFMRTITL